MDYETADGSQFSLREIWTEHDDTPTFSCTSVTSFVEGKAFAGRLNKALHLLDDDEILACLEPVPPENINPPFPPEFTRAPSLDSSKYYLKAPSFTYDDAQNGKSFVADCLLNEATVLEQLKKTPHPNIVSYHGCVVEDSRIIRLCLSRYEQNLTSYIDERLSEDRKIQIMGDVEAGVLHLHSLGLAHNDINPDNICLGQDGHHAVIIDFDSCMPFGQRLMKGKGNSSQPEDDGPISARANDFDGLDMIHDFLWPRPDENTPRADDI
ncbi:Hypothetical protein R9X50_00301400 [Acrodontium crateriforme]|uniref:non-specific serine/threonine protein kinase n=1 Tax=Acrodontium crateriforme TaxID=150365 RepID=A0AAQ3M5F1_9PEZI|nr:Hypothetical protein R9X50_00301400 [Acrodontium crateriforme]